MDVTVDNFTDALKVDTGAEVSAVLGDFPTAPARYEKVESLLTVPGGQPLRALGSHLTRLQWQEKTSSQIPYVIDFLYVPLLDLPVIQALEAVRFVGGVQAPETILNDDLYRELGTFKDIYNIRLKHDVVPFSFSAPRWILTSCARSSGGGFRNWRETR